MSKITNILINKGIYAGKYKTVTLSCLLRDELSSGTFMHRLSSSDLSRKISLDLDTEPGAPDVSNRNL